MGYHIPKGAGILNNVFTIHHDPKRYPNPNAFDPERFKDDKQNLYDSAQNPDAAKRDQFTFGAGRRVCAGMHVAERSLFLGISRLLWTFDIKPAVDKESGKPIMPNPDKLTQGFVCMPEPFQASITPRSRERADLIRREWDAAQKSLDPDTKKWREIPEGLKLSSLK